MREPAFWWKQGSGTLLVPLAGLYGAAAAWRMHADGQRAGVPVVCLGNLTVGGAGKTPTALAIAGFLASAGEQPAFLTRGYGGRLAGPLLVEPARHHAAEVGDEPLLLARAAPTIVARERVAGAALAVKCRAGAVVMDDGFQNPSLTKDFSVLVLDGRRGVGNGCVVPAGPLRAPVIVQLERAQALIVVGPALDSAKTVANVARAQGIPVFAARLEPDAGALATLRGKRVLAFAGIGDPERFFATLAAAGIAVAAKRGFADHHRYTEPEARTLCEAADRDGLTLVTTEKDQARLAGESHLVTLAQRVHPLPVALKLEDEVRFKSLLLQHIAAARQWIANG